MNEPDSKKVESSGRRQDERMTINKEFDSFDAFVNEYVSNVSRTGVFIRSANPLTVGTKVNLKFTVLADKMENIEGIGEVVRVHEDPPGMGIVFSELSRYSQAIIQRLLTIRAAGT